ncbi:gluconate 2-dehydrogenase subunit 3 family protein [Aestuariibaculum suncheonense]
MPVLLGGVVASSTLFTVLVSCREEVKSEQSLLSFFNDEERAVLSHLVGLILPASDTVGAMDVNVPIFINRVLEHVLNRTEQMQFIKGQDYFIGKFKSIFKKEVSQGNQSEFLEILTAYFDVSEDKQQQIFKIMEQSENDVENEELYYIYKYLTFIRHYTLYGYYTSEIVGKEILNYDPFPGAYEPCVPVTAVGNSSSI